MNLNQLEYFVSVADNLNFTRAAAKCFISQTAMTQQIKALEATVGVPLFIRDKHHVELTAAGRAYLHEARIILDRSNEAMRLARLAAEGHEGQLTIGFINGFGQSDFSEILNAFRKAYPGIKITLVRGNMSVLRDALEKKELDVVFAMTPYNDHSQTISGRYLRSYPVLAVLPEGHPLAGRQVLTYEELENEDFIMMQPTNRPKDQMEESMLIYQRGGYLPKVTAVEGEPETLLLMISVGLGISILPEYIIRRYQKNQGLVIVPMVKADQSAETIDMSVSWLNDHENPAIEQLLEML